MITRRTALAAATAATLSGPAGAQQAARPLVIAHRGASGHRPEHTLMAYKLAIEQGADVIEPDLVVTKDGTLVCRHETEIEGTTDVASIPRFANRSVPVRGQDGRERMVWHAEDFLLAELNAVRARERLPDLRPESARFDGQEQVPTFQQVIDLARSEAARLGRPVGLYPELKAPAALLAKGFDTAALLLDQLNRAGLPRTEVPVYIQSFEALPLRRLSGRTHARIVQLVQTASMTTVAGLRDIATYAQGVGIEKSLITRAIVENAHQAGLMVHAWTFRAENQFLPEDLRRGTDRAAHGDMAAEIRRYVEMGVDGLFSDFPGLAKAALG